MLGRALARLRGARRIEWMALLAALAAAVLLLTGAHEERTQPASLERRMEAVLSMVEGAGRVRVLVNSPETGGAVSGAVVVAEGAADLRVRLELEQAVRTLLGVESERVEILIMREDGE